MNHYDYESLTVPLHDEPPAKRQPLELEPMATKKAPRIPRDTEPCHLWEFIAFAAGGLSVLVGLMWIAGWSFARLVEVLS